MKLETNGKKENKALERQEVALTLKEAKTTPSRKELRPKIAALLGAKEELTVITSIRHAFGKTDAEIKANIYENQDAMEKNEQKHLIKRDKGKEAKAEEKTQAKEEKPEAAEKPAEEGKKEAEKEGEQ